ncbi:hypothetical protein F5Y08DRAFT_165287 [Xylaria arbuscula]|nr:hypothetical protein F5Y08DRAFT_165287 [Xylaria arbuscula]
MSWYCSMSTRFMYKYSQQQHMMRRRRFESPIRLPRHLFSLFKQLSHIASFPQTENTRTYSRCSALLLLSSWPPLASPRSTMATSVPGVLSPASKPALSMDALRASMSTVTATRRTNSLASLHPAPISAGAPLKAESPASSTRAHAFPEACPSSRLSRTRPMFGPPGDMLLGSLGSLASSPSPSASFTFMASRLIPSTCTWQLLLCYNR